ncbi:hypothetical protein [Prescottella agglutinans]|uniref:hypothetical protein n=1 Tax=Prescottella agglutinans TaxID=1644129 RepID=UPI003D97E2E0
MTDVHMVATSNAADLGLRALADLAAAADGIEYRVVGGHMVHVLGQVYPTPSATARTTADADAGIDTVIAASNDLHERLLQIGYTAVSGNRYEAPSGDTDPLAVDLLIPSGSSRLQESVPHGDRAFDAIPGLSLALAADPLDVRIHATLHSGVTLTFDIPVPDVEPAVVLKALAWNNRHAPRDVADLCSLFAIVHEHQLHKDRWKLTTAKGGTRLDTARALHSLVAMIDREQPIEGLTMPAPRLAALIRAYVGEPG